MDLGIIMYSPFQTLHCEPAALPDQDLQARGWGDSGAAGNRDDQTESCSDGLCYGHRDQGGNIPESQGFCFDLSTRVGFQP